MLLFRIGLVAATLVGASQPTQDPIERKRKAIELEIHFANAAKETHYEHSLFTRKELEEIEEDFNPSRFSARRGNVPPGDRTEAPTAAVVPSSEKAEFTRGHQYSQGGDPNNVAETASVSDSYRLSLRKRDASIAVVTTLEPSGTEWATEVTTTVVPSAAEWARERYMLFSFLQRNPRESLAPLLEAIQAQIPGSAMTIERLERDKLDVFHVAVVPTWFHEAMMSLEPLGDSFNIDALPWLLSQAPIGSPLLRHSEQEAQITARIWFEYCVKPTRLNHTGGPFCVKSHRIHEHYALTRSQLNRYLERFKQVVSRYI